MRQVGLIVSHLHRQHHWRDMTAPSITVGSRDVLSTTKTVTYPWPIVLGVLGYDRRTGSTLVSQQPWCWSIGVYQDPRYYYDTPVCIGRQPPTKPKWTKKGFMCTVVFYTELHANLASIWSVVYNIATDDFLPSDMGCRPTYAYHSWNRHRNCDYKWLVLKHLRSFDEIKTSQDQCNLD